MRIGQLERSQVARVERLYEHVCVCEELTQALMVPLPLDVQDDAALPERQRGPVERGFGVSLSAAREGRQRPGLCPCRGLDLDDLGTEVGQDPTG